MPGCLAPEQEGGEGVTDEITVDLEGLSKIMCPSCYNAFLRISINVKLEQWDKVEEGMKDLCNTDLELIMLHIESLLVNEGYMERRDGI